MFVCPSVGLFVPKVSVKIYKNSGNKTLLPVLWTTVCTVCQNNETRVIVNILYSCESVAVKFKTGTGITGSRLRWSTLT